MGKIMALKNFYDALFIEALFAFSDACLLYKTEDQSMSKSAAMGDCAHEKARYDNKLKKYESAFQQVYHDCIYHVATNVDDMVDKVLGRYGNNYRGKYEELSKIIISRIETGYFWVDAVVSVYPEVYGHHVHQLKNVHVWKRKNGHNVVVMMERKEAYWSSRGILN